jgi:hypothetical protein
MSQASGAKTACLSPTHMCVFCRDFVCDNCITGMVESSIPGVDCVCGRRACMESAKSLPGMVKTGKLKHPSPETAVQELSRPRPPPARPIVLSTIPSDVPTDLRVAATKSGEEREVSDDEADVAVLPVSEASKYWKWVVDGNRTRDEQLVQICETDVRNLVSFWSSFVCSVKQCMISTLFHLTPRW